MSPENLVSKLGITNVYTVSENETVEKALKYLEEKNVRAAPVVDENGVFKGLFSSHEIIKSLVPAYLSDGFLTLDFVHGASTTLSGRLKKLYPTKVCDHVCARDTFTLSSHTQSWEALRILTKYGSPIPVVEEGTGVLKGLITDQSAINALLNMDLEEEDSDAA